MRTLADAETMLLNELRQWFIKQSQDLYQDFYLYYQESTAEHNGGIGICSGQPANPSYKLAWNERINKGATIEQNFHYLRTRILKQLPILDI